MADPPPQSQSACGDQDNAGGAQASRNAIIASCRFESKRAELRPELSRWRPSLSRSERVTPDSYFTSIRRVTARIGLLNGDPAADGSREDRHRFWLLRRHGCVLRPAADDTCLAWPARRRCLHGRLRIRLIERSSCVQLARRAGVAGARRVDRAVLSDHPSSNLKERAFHLDHSLVGLAIFANRVRPGSA